MSRSVSRMPWERLEPLRLPEDHALVHAWLGHHLSTPLAGVETLLGVSPHLSALRLATRPFPRSSPGSGDLLMRLHLGAGGQVTLRLGGALVQSLLARLGEPLDAPPAPPQAQSRLSTVAPLAPPLPVTPAEAGVVAALVAAALGDLAPGEIALDDVWAPPLPGVPADTEDEWATSADESAFAASLWCESRWTLGNTTGGALHARLDAEAAQALRRAARTLPPPVAAARAASLALSFDFIAAEARATASEAAALLPDDVIAFPHSQPAGAACVQGWLTLEGWRLAARLQRTPEGRCLTLLGEEISMPEQDLPASPGASSTHASQAPGDPLARPRAPGPGSPVDRLDRLPVRISVTLGKVTLSAADVLRLAPGAVIELHEPLGGPVEVLAGGQPFAQGELVTVDGALGVRITALIP